MSLSVGCCSAGLLPTIAIAIVIVRPPPSPKIRGMHWRRINSGHRAAYVIDRLTEFALRAREIRSFVRAIHH